jgi:hypothetical protein
MKSPTTTWCDIYFPLSRGHGGAQGRRKKKLRGILILRRFVLLLKVKPIGPDLTRQK